MKLTCLPYTNSEPSERNNFRRNRENERKYLEKVKMERQLAAINSKKKSCDEDSEEERKNNFRKNLENERKCLEKLKVERQLATKKKSSCDEDSEDERNTFRKNLENERKYLEKLKTERQLTAVKKKKSCDEDSEEERNTFRRELENERKYLEKLKADKQLAAIKKKSCDDIEEEEDERISNSWFFQCCRRRRLPAKKVHRKRPTFWQRVRGKLKRKKKPKKAIFEEEDEKIKRKKKKEMPEYEAEKPDKVEDAPPETKKEIDFTKSCCYLCAKNTMAIAAALTKGEKFHISIQASTKEIATSDKSCSPTIYVRTVQSSVKVRTRDIGTSFPEKKKEKKAKKAKPKLKIPKRLQAMIPKLRFPMYPKVQTVACETDKSMIPQCRARQGVNCVTEAKVAMQAAKLKADKLNNQNCTNKNFV
ncbi:eukaryotic translation initiation factor 5B isoform X3 [Apis mellifera]|uniref:Eukaryotic translation initiation factor 5B isoform X3 n=1 Tax=Apis mellifera TaxID=7460 RepID=A0A7M7GY89_APIME|nr:eukaryotic translation initiation factor 5B isoform X3 [Apis mellifera]|eukprot:XP_006563681.1 eukaryotic translation initiation factor 5B isoform X3 [Apis mellifera]